MTKSTKKSGAENIGVFVYLGPSIRGVIQNGAIFHGTREQIANQLSDAIEKRPAIKRLLVRDTEIAAVKAQLNSGKGALSIAYKRLLGD